MTFLRMPLAVLAAVACCAFVKPASASVIGTLDIANCTNGDVVLSQTSITWLPAGTEAGTGCINTGAGTNLTYSGGSLGGGVTGNIQDLIGGGGAVDQFMTFEGTTLDFVLTDLGSGSLGTNCTGLGIGQSCSPSAGSPFILTSMGPVTLVSFSASGTIDDDGVTGTWSGVFTTQALASTAAIQTALMGNGSITSTYSGQFDVISVDPVPEPSTISMLLAGAAFLFVGLNRRKA